MSQALQFRACGFGGQVGNRSGHVGAARLGPLTPQRHIWIFPFPVLFWEVVPGYFYGSDSRERSLHCIVGAGGPRSPCPSERTRHLCPLRCPRPGRASERALQPRRRAFASETERRRFPFWLLAMGPRTCYLNSLSFCVLRGKRQQ